MKERRTIRAIHSLIFLLVAVLGNAQEKTTVHASVDKTSILIGEQINFILEANIPENDPIGFFNVDSIAHFEFISKGKIDTTNTNKGTVLKQLFRLTSFDSGQFVIPSYHLPQSEEIKTDSFLINVGYMPMDTTKDYNDIKEIIEVAKEKKTDWTWYYVGAAALLAILLIYLLTKRKKKKEMVVQKEEVIDPYTEALNNLEQLRKENLPARDETKLYYSRLTDIFRVYVEKRKGIHSLQQTTDDLVRQLKSIQLSNEQYERLAHSLRQSDFVKFAKYVPTENDNEETFVTIKNTIETIEKLSPAVQVNKQ
ncbi:MAG: hypothetical protein QM764_15455 [Chitinophagaceae bacterium]